MIIDDQKMLEIVSKLTNFSVMRPLNKLWDLWLDGLVFSRKGEGIFDMFEMFKSEHCCAAMLAVLKIKHLSAGLLLLGFVTPAWN